MEYAIGVILVFLTFLIFLWTQEEIEARRELRRAQMTDLDALYNDIWTGNDLDRVHAWYRVISHLKAWNYNPELIREATRRMEALKKERMSDSYVNVNGNPVLRRESI